MDVIAALQNSIEIAGKLRALSKKVEDADFKMLVADLLNKLADAKLDAANLKTELADARTQALRQLQDQLEKAREENEALRDQLDLKGKELGALNDQVKVLSERLDPTSASRLEDLKETLLLALASHEELLEEQIASHVKSGRQVVVFEPHRVSRRPVGLSQTGLV